MKRILVIAILLSYSIASFGVSLTYFYCCGKLKTVSIAVSTEEKSSTSKSTKGCCENKSLTLKLKTDQKSSDQTKFQFTAPLSKAILHTTNSTVAYIANIGNVNSLFKRPPPGNLPSRQVLFCVFRI
ncbi:MAG: hypothetical protein ABIU11_00970 [Chitinophagaceae bacterium]